MERIPLPFSVPLPVVGMVHLGPLPGSPGWAGSLQAILERARDDAQSMAEEGVDGLLVENYSDTPFFPAQVPPECVAGMTAAIHEIRDVVDLPVGVNVLRNDARSALGIAAATRAEFIRVNVHVGSMFTDQGLLQGQAHETLRTRRALGCPAAILADVMVKHAQPPAGVTLEECARDTWYRGKADGLIVSGLSTGGEPSSDELRRARGAVPEAPIWIGSGLRPDNVADLLPLADGAIVGSSFQVGGTAGAGVERSRVRRFMEEVRAIRG